MSRHERVARIYALADPRDGRIRYIGQTRTSIHERLMWHLEDRRSCPRTRWIRELTDEGRCPVILLLETCGEREADDRERWWIEFGSERWPLTNRGGVPGRRGRE